MNKTGCLLLIELKIVKVWCDQLKGGGRRGLKSDHVKPTLLVMSVTCNMRIFYPSVNSYLIKQYISPRGYPPSNENFATFNPFLFYLFVRWFNKGQFLSNYALNMEILQIMQNRKVNPTCEQARTLLSSSFNSAEKWKRRNFFQN